MKDLIAEVLAILEGLNKSDNCSDNKKKLLKNILEKDLKISSFEVPEEFLLNKILEVNLINKEEAFRIGLLACDYYGHDNINTDIIFEENAEQDLESISREKLLAISYIIILGSIEFKKFLLMVYYTRHCFINNESGTLAFSEFIKIRTGNDYSINKIKNKNYSNNEYISVLEHKNIYDSYEKKLKKIIINLGEDVTIPLYSKMSQLLEDDILSKEELIIYQNGIKEHSEIADIIKETMTNYSSVFLPKSGIDDLVFIFDELSSNLAFKRFQSGKIDKIKDKDLKDLKEKTIGFFVNKKENSYNEAFIKTESIFKLLTEETIKKQEEYYDKMEDILKEAMNIFIQELSEIQIEHLPLTPNELKKREKHIIETYIIEVKKP